MCYKPRLQFPCCRFPPAHLIASFDDHMPITRMCALYGRPGHLAHTILDDWSVTYPLRCGPCHVVFIGEWDAAIAEAEGWFDALLAGDHGYDEETVAIIEGIRLGLQADMLALQTRFREEADLFHRLWWEELEVIAAGATWERVERDAPNFRLDYERYRGDYVRLVEQAKEDVTGFVGVGV